MKFFNWIAGFFEEDSQQSMMRVCTLILIVWGCKICDDNPEHAMTGLEMIGAGLLGKGYQKWQEGKKNKKQDGKDEREIVH